MTTEAFEWAARAAALADTATEHDPAIEAYALVSIALSLAQVRVAAHTREEDRPFVVRQFEGKPWVPLHEAARLHDAHQRAELALIALQNHIQTYGPLPAADNHNPAARDRLREALALLDAGGRMVPSLDIPSGSERVVSIVRARDAVRLAATTETTDHE